MNTKEAIEVLEKCLCSGFTFQDESHLKALNHAIEVMKASEWRPFSEWHEDYGDCLFSAWNHRTGEYEVLFTNPLSSDWKDEYSTFFITQFMRVTLTQPPQREG